MYACQSRPWLGTGLQFIRQRFWNLIWVPGTFTFIFKNFEGAFSKPRRNRKSNLAASGHFENFVFEIITPLERVIHSLICYLKQIIHFWCILLMIWGQYQVKIQDGRQWLYAVYWKHWCLTYSCSQKVMCNISF